MADTLTFTNNLGTTTLKNALYSISHSYKWKDSSGVIPIFTLSATGTIHKDNANIHGVAPYVEGEAPLEGGTGTLTLPHATYTGMAIKSYTHSDGTWTPYGKATIEFTDESGDDNLSRYMIHWWGHNIYTPKITFGPSKLRRAESSVFGLNGWYRQLQGYSMMTMNIEGLIEVTTTPTSFIETLEKVYTGASASDAYRKGYPLVYDLKDAIPEAEGDANIDFHNVMVTGGGARWNFEKHYADVFINLIIPPQKIEAS